MAIASAAVADMSADDKKSRLCQFSKTKMCKFNVLGKCTKGEKCPFAHEGLELRKLPDLRCTKLCKVLIQTGQCTSKSCTYAHSKEELRSTGAFHKTKLCRFMQTGHCTLGAKCNFAHSSVELREPETIDLTLEPPPGLGWESMLGGLLSDGEEDSADDKPGAKDDTKAKRSSKDFKPAYVRVRPMPDSWPFGSACISEESTDCEDGFGQFQEDAALTSFWDGYAASQQLPYGGMDFQLGDLGGYSPEGSNFACGGAFNEWTGPWAGQPMAEHYASSLFSGALAPWDWRSFGDSVVIDQKDELKVKSAKPDKATPKMRSVRTSESTICTLGDTAQA